jgi:branched-chain amino acid transport system substrate-binding protein
MTGHRIRWSLLVVAIVAALGLISCKSSNNNSANNKPVSTGGAASTTAGTPQPKFSGQVNVGMSTTLSGSIAALGKSGVQGVTLAIDDLNAKGGLLGKEVVLKSVDDQAKPDVGTTNVRNLILNDKVVAIFGPVASSVAAAEEGVAQQYKIPIFFHTSNDVVLTTKQFNKYVFQLVPNTYMEPRAIADYLAKQGFKKYYTISPDYNYGHDTVDALLKALKDFGANVEVAGQQWPPLGASDFTSYISAALSAKPDLLFLGIYGGDIVTFTKQALGFNLFSQTKVGGAYDLVALSTLGEQMPSGVIAWSRGPFYAIDTPGVKDFAQRYHQRFGEWPTEWSLLAYTAVQAWADGVKKANSFDGDKVADALSGATVSTIRGDITLRACDHMAEIPEYVGTVSASVDPTYGFKILQNVFVAQPKDIMMTCEQAQALQPKQ